MSNRACIQRTIFVNHGSNEKTYGFRIYDDCGQDYCNSMLENDLNLPEKEFLQKAKLHFSEVANSIFDFALGTGGIYIDDNWYILDKQEEE